MTAVKLWMALKVQPMQGKKKKKSESVQMMVKWLMHIHFSNNMTWSALAKEGKTHTNKHGMYTQTYEQTRHRTLKDRNKHP